MSVTFKQIYYDGNSGKLLILDSQNNNYECNLYGEKTAHFQPNVSGIASYRERAQNTGMSYKSNFDSTFYRPQSNRFEGYFQFPRPLSRPFFNINIKGEIHDRLDKIMKEEPVFTSRKNKHLLELKSNQGVHYLTSNLSLTDDTSKIKLMQMMDKYIEEFREKNKHKMKSISKEPKIRALNKLKNMLSSNFGDKIIFGRQLPMPDSTVSHQYSINTKLIRGEIGEKNNYKAMMNLTRSILRNGDTSADRSFNVSRMQMSRTQMSKTAYFEADKKGYKDELSFLSRDSDENNLVENKKIKPKSLMDKQCEKEKKLLKGFQIPIVKERGVLEKSAPKFIKSAGQLYFENLALLKKVNPIAFQNEERKNELFDLVLKKKLQSKLVYQKNLGF